MSPFGFHSFGTRKRSAKAREIDNSGIHIVRPLDGHLMLFDADSGRALTHAIPDAEFRLWLRRSGTETVLIARNPERMNHVRVEGVSLLPDDADILASTGFKTRADSSYRNMEDTKRARVNLGLPITLKELEPIP